MSWAKVGNEIVIAFLVFLVICEWARHNLRIKWAWTLWDNNLSSRSFKNSSKKSSASGDKMEMSYEWLSHLTNNSASGGFATTSLVWCRGYWPMRLWPTGFLTDGHLTDQYTFMDKWQNGTNDGLIFDRLIFDRQHKPVGQM